MCSFPDFILAVLVIFCPPAVAWIKTRRQDLCLNLILTLLVWFPGMLHAWYLIVKHPDHNRRPVALDARVEHVNTVYADAPQIEAQAPQTEVQAPPYPERQQQGVVEGGKPPKYGK